MFRKKKYRKRKQADKGKDFSVAAKSIIAAYHNNKAQLGEEESVIVLISDEPNEKGFPMLQAYTGCPFNMAKMIYYFFFGNNTGNIVRQILEWFEEQFQQKIKQESAQQ